MNEYPFKESLVYISIIFPFKNIVENYSVTQIKIYLLWHHTKSALKTLLLKLLNQQIVTFLKKIPILKSEDNEIQEKNYHSV